MAKLFLLFFAAIVLFDLVPALPKNEGRTRRRGFEESPERRYFNIGIGGSDKYAAENERQAFPENDVDGSKFYRPLRGKDSHFRGNKYIVGGDKAGNHHNMASIRKANKIIPNSYCHFCGGSIINSRWILTAAYCIEGIKERREEFIVVVGTHLLNVSHSIYKIQDAFSYPLYNRINLQNDIGLIQVTHPMPKGRKPFGLDNKQKIYEGYLLFTGWGSECVAIDKPTNNLKYYYAKALSNSECQCRWRGIKEIFDSHICTSTHVDKGFCYGDTGGPLAYWDNKERQFIQVGVASWGCPCTKGFPDVFTRVSFYYEWIRSFIGK